ncbi:hypothetical protein AMS68_001413 [Peltaster fructicola]|uniref:DUF726 domain protein n=1 Tax=Peltaster fructicola TaxID=286661 RepID=A0A6H0XMG4_9PEZI|nr:hypothetical protein AMS68_001413 [Peltaster fructicola]
MHENAQDQHEPAESDGTREKPSPMAVKSEPGIVNNGKDDAVTKQRVHDADEDDFHDATTTQESIEAKPALAPLETVNDAETAPETEAETAAARPTTPVRSESPTAPTSPISKNLVEQLAQSPTQTHQSKNSVSLPFSEWSHQQLANQTEEKVEETDEGEWQAMPALATHRVYDDFGKVLAKSYDEVVDEESYGYNGLGGAGKGYTKVHLDDDVASQTSFDDNTAYLFKDGYARNALDEDDETRDVISQMQTTKELLTEGQRIAYVGVVRLSMIRMLEAMDAIERTKAVKKMADFASESMRLWSQKMMVRVYSHMDIDSREQVMVEQLAEHGVLPEDLTPALMQNARVKNPKQTPMTSPTSPRAEHQPGATIDETIGAANVVPVEDLATAENGQPPSHDNVKVDQRSPGDGAEDGQQQSEEKQPISGDSPKGEQQPQAHAEIVEDEQVAAPQTTSTTIDKTEAPEVTTHAQAPQSIATQGTAAEQIEEIERPPSYEQTNAEGLHVERPEDLPDTQDIDLDIRWTVLCDLFLLIIADGTYDARSRILLEHVGKALAIEWQEICRFEKRVTDALEMQEQAGKETWDEGDHLEAREKAARNKRLIVMGLCTVGGGLVIGLSAGLLAPVIGAGLAAGFTSIGVAGTSSFFAGAGAATLIGTTGAGIGARIGINASARRTGAVKTFEYRPLHNNKRVNLIVTVSGWMTGKVDDVRLPFSTVDPVMGDIYSIHWEPEMLQSTGQTIQILGTEALTQTIQQVLGATFLSTLMAGLAAPLVLTKLAYLIDNPWTVSLARADAAGLILADSLIDRNLGARPITLIGFSLGARLIFSCLKEMARRGALGIVQNVYLFGSPIVTKNDEWLKAKTIVSGRMVNGYASHDWILGYLFRATSGGLRSIAGLSKVNVPGVENIDVAEIVPGHMAYRGMMPILLAECGFEVDSEEFTEIEDPDPDNHERRQRELINDIEEARRQLEEKPEKKGFLARFSRKKASKKEWETYDEKSTKIDDDQDPEKIIEQNSHVMFDVEAIRREALELAKQGEPIEDIKAHIKIREIKSTLPPMRISSAMLAPSPQDKDTIRQTRSHDEPTRSFSFTNGAPSPDPSNVRPSMETTASDDRSRTSTPQPSNSRPVLRSHLTTPNIASASEPSLPSASTVKKNQWDDEDDANFGKEEAIEMSFE